jgi:hypothetical protein
MDLRYDWNRSVNQVAHLQDQVSKLRLGLGTAAQLE